MGRYGCIVEKIFVVRISKVAVECNGAFLLSDSRGSLEQEHNWS